MIDPKKISKSTFSWLARSYSRVWPLFRERKTKNDIGYHQGIHTEYERNECVSSWMAIWLHTNSVWAKVDYQDNREKMFKKKTKEFVGYCWQPHSADLGRFRQSIALMKETVSFFSLSFSGLLWNTSDFSQCVDAETKYYCLMNEIGYMILSLDRVNWPNIASDDGPLMAGTWRH